MSRLKLGRTTFVVAILAVMTVLTAGVLMTQPAQAHAAQGDCIAYGENGSSTIEITTPTSTTSPATSTTSPATTTTSTAGATAKTSDEALPFILVAVAISATIGGLGVIVLRHRQD